MQNHSPMRGGKRYEKEGFDGGFHDHTGLGGDVTTMVDTTGVPTMGIIPL